MNDDQEYVESLLLKKIIEANSFQDRALAVETYARFREICTGTAAIYASTNAITRLSQTLSSESE